jgi:mRNA-degrading endonuclease YafQ of YafQ-DinJ toxin-antitoxin module
MTKEIKRTTKFKKQYKKIRYNPKWKLIFSKGTMADPERSPFEYIVGCLLNEIQIPKYYYAHPINLSKDQMKSLKSRAGVPEKSIKVLELHFDGHNGNHLLVYCDLKDVVYLVAIGTHSDLF